MNALQRAAGANAAVRVSGLRPPNGDVRVTRIDPAVPGEPARVTGPVTRIVPGGASRSAD